MSLHEPSIDDLTAPAHDPARPDRDAVATIPPADADRRRSLAAIRTENRLLRARAAALERKLRDDREERRRVIERYEALLSERQAGGPAGERAAGESSVADSGPAALRSNVLTAVRNWLARR